MSRTRSRKSFSKHQFHPDRSDPVHCRAHEVNATGLADYVDAARGAKTPREVLFYVESAEMLQRQHAKAPVQGVLTDSRAMVATVSGVAMALLPLDYLVWTEAVAEPSSEIAERARKELGAGGLEMHLTGQASERAARSLRRWAGVYASGFP